MDWRKNMFSTTVVKSIDELRPGDLIGWSFVPDPTTMKGYVIIDHIDDNAIYGVNSPTKDGLTRAKDVTLIHNFFPNDTWVIIYKNPE